MNTYCLKIKNGKPFRWPNGRVQQPAVNERRKLDDHFEHIRDLTEEQRGTLLEQFEIAFRQLFRVRSFFQKWSAKEIRKIVLKVLDELEAEE